jgi:hypothetical protein
MMQRPTAAFIELILIIFSYRGHRSPTDFDSVDNTRRHRSPENSGW